jgi:hypothetical protein
MSTPDALPMEIALIALPLFEFQVYSTSLRHYYHRPITLSTFRLLHQSQLYTPWHRSMPCDYLLRSSFVHRISALHMHSTASHSLSYPEFNCNIFPRLLSVSPSLFSLQSHASRLKSHGTHLRQYCSHHQSL